MLVSTSSSPTEPATPLATLLKQVQEEPVPPSVRTELPIPADLAAVILACLAKDPRERPQTATELDARLAACSGDVWVEEQAREWWTLHLGGYGSDPGEPPSM